MGEAYLNALDQKDLAKITSLVDPGIHCKTPLAEVFDRDAFIMSMRRMLANLKGVHLIAKFSSGGQATFIYEVIFNEPVGTIKAASLMTLEGDKIKDMEIFFDARPFERVYGTQPEFKKAA